MVLLLEKTEEYIVKLFNEKLEAQYVYHNLVHTQRVVDKAKELAVLAKLSEEDTHKILIATWFHDTGFTVDANNHEDKSIEIATNFLREHKIEDSVITEISNLISVTKLGNKPSNLLERIIKDADCSHIGSKNYDDFSQLLHKEIELTSKNTIKELDWVTNNIDFLTNEHQFYTDIAFKKWGKQKSKNLAQLLKEEKKILQEKEKLSQKKEELAFKKNKVELPERGIETMFRVALRNHITLSDIADTKANILLSVNAIIISISLSTLLPKLDNPSNGYLIAPTIIFILFIVVSMILSIMATKPNVTQGKFTKEDVENKKVNLIFFGNFHKMSLTEFEWAMDEMMKDKDYLYSSLTKDLYFLGLVLNRKYNLLRTTYTVFMIGIIVSVLAYGIAFYMQNANASI